VRKSKALEERGGGRLRTRRGKHHAREQNDLHSIKVFDPSIKGETDRFAYWFVKP
jgi:predicted methyltransferase